MKKLDFNKSVYDLAKEYPEVVDIMVDLGFSQIKKKAMLNSMGKVMTIPRGAKMHDIPMDEIVKKFEENGFEILNYTSDDNKEIKEENTQDEEQSRTSLLKSYLKRLGSGEDLESVRSDFRENFEGVDSREIMKVEEELIAEGTPLNEVQRLCDLHSALFHGQTFEEKIAKAHESNENNNYTFDRSKYDKKMTVTKELIDTLGHPLNIFSKENRVLEELIKKAKKSLEDKKDFYEAFYNLRDISIHYAKKGDLLYPHLESKYNITGPSKVMWTVDDEIRAELTSLLSDKENADKNYERFKSLLKRIEEMIYKEENILFPNCAMNFTKDEWILVYNDMKDYESVFGIKEESWNEAKDDDVTYKIDKNRIKLSGGHLKINELDALLNTIPLEITFVDKENINRYFNEGEKMMKRPKMAIDRNVMSCHPPKIQTLVNSIIEDFRTGRKDNVPVWLNKRGHTLYINYIAVRDDKDNYLGTLEIVQDMEFAKKHFLEDE